MVPSSFTWANTIAVVISLQVAIVSVLDFRLALNIEDAHQFGDESQFAALQPSLAGQREILNAQRSGLQSAITSIRPWRLATEALLAASAAAVFIMALRMRVATAGRAEIAVLLGRAAIAAAVVRAIDGAQNLVIARTVASAVGEVLAKSPPAMMQASDQAELPLDTTVTAMAGIASVAGSLLVVSVFMGLATYFRSERLRAALLKVESSS